MTLDKVFRERESLNVSIVDAINKASLAWVSISHKDR